jgi:hypothetical protein
VERSPSLAQPPTYDELGMEQIRLAWHGPARWLIASLALALVSVTAVRAVEQADFYLEWDPSTDASVVGYRVFIGTQSGIYSEAHNVFGSTSFTYSGLPWVRYYFAVASYYPGSLLGPLSKEVSGVVQAGSPTTSGTVTWASTSIVSDGSPDSRPAEGPSGLVQQRTNAAATDLREPFVLKEWTESVGSVSAMACLPTGEVLLVEEGRFVRRLVGGQINERIAEIREGRISGLVADPTFERSGLIYLGVTTVRARAEELDVIRYRLVGGRLGEAARIVVGLPVQSRSDTPLALDGKGHIYIALPGETGPEGRLEPHQGTIVRLGTDGSTPSDNPKMSPDFVRGFELPTDLKWDASLEGLWLAGSDREREGSIAFVAVGGQARHESYALTTYTEDDVVTVLESQESAVVAPRGRPELVLLIRRSQRLPHKALVVDSPAAAGLTPDGRIIAALRRTNGSSRSRIVVVDRRTTGNP